MKKILMAAMLIIAGTSVQAQNNINKDGIEFNSEYIYNMYTPAMFSSDGKTYIHVDNLNEAKTQCTIDIYNDDVEKVKSFTINGYESGDYFFTKKRKRLDNVKLVLHDVFDLQEKIECSSLDEAKKVLKEKYDYNVDSSFVEEGGLIVLVDYNNSGFYEQEDFGYKYPNRGYAYGVDKQLYRFDYIYTSDRKYPGDWVETISSTDNDFYEKLHLIDTSQSIEKSISFSQKLFNNDDNYEYLQLICKPEVFRRAASDRDGDGEIDYIETNYRHRPIGFKVVSENGNELQRLNFNTHNYNIFDGLSLLRINEKFYLVASFIDQYLDNPINSKGWSIFYSITPGQSGGIQQVGEPIQTSVFPTLANSNEVITVEDEDTANANREVVVTNANGQTVYRQTLPAGQSSVQINTGRLSKGLNIVNVLGSKSQAKGCKVIVK